MGKDLLIYDSLGLIPQPHSDFYSKGSEQEEEGGTILPPLPRHHRRNRSQHAVSPVLQSMCQRIMSAIKLWAFSKLCKEEGSSCSSLGWATHPNPDETSVDVKMTGYTIWNCTGEVCSCPLSASPHTICRTSEERTRSLSCTSHNNQAGLLHQRCPQGPPRPRDPAAALGATHTGFADASATGERIVGVWHTTCTEIPVPAPRRNVWNQGPLSLWNRIPASLINESLISRLVNHKIIKSLNEL